MPNRIILLLLVCCLISSESAVVQALPSEINQSAQLIVKSSPEAAYQSQVAVPSILTKVLFKGVTMKTNEYPVSDTYLEITQKKMDKPSRPPCTGCPMAETVFRTMGFGVISVSIFSEAARTEPVKLIEIIRLWFIKRRAVFCRMFNVHRHFKWWTYILPPSIKRILKSCLLCSSIDETRHFT